MHLTEVLRPEYIWSALSSTNKDAVIKELARSIAGVVKNISEDTLVKILLEREQLGSTGIQDGIAIPHGKLPGLEKIVIACGRSIEGVNFDAHDAKPTYLFFVLLAPESAAGLHLKILARLSKLLKEPSFRDKLMKANDAAEIYKAIADEDEKLRC